MDDLTGSALHRLVRTTTMASADFCRTSGNCFSVPLHRISPSAGRQISPGNARDLHPIYPPHLQPHPPDGYWASSVTCLLARLRLPHMRFLFVGPGFCLRLPSDSASRRTPLPSGYRFPPSGSEEDLHLQVTNQPPQLIGWRSRATRHAWRTNKKGQNRNPAPRAAHVSLHPHSTRHPCQLPRRVNSLTTVNHIWLFFSPHWGATRIASGAEP